MSLCIVAIVVRVNNCVGVNNHKFFMLFCFYIAVGSMYALALLSMRYYTCLPDLETQKVPDFTYCQVIIDALVNLYFLLTLFSSHHSSLSSHFSLLFSLCSLLFFLLSSVSSPFSLSSRSLLYTFSSLLAILSSHSFISSLLSLLSGRPCSLVAVHVTYRRIGVVRTLHPHHVPGPNPWHRHEYRNSD